MSMMLAEHELFDACRVLFGTDLNVTHDFLEYLQASGLKTAYRKRALETHPDRIAAMGVNEQQHDTNLFLQVQTAYEGLTSYIDARKKGVIIKPSRTATGRWQYHNNSTNQNSSYTGAYSTHTKKRPDDNSSFRNRWKAKADKNKTRSNNTTNSANWDFNNRFNGKLPERELLFGHFLYYSGIISWRQIVQALVWQRANRPRLGELGKRFGWLDNNDILTVLRSRTSATPFGETAMDLGLLTKQQLQTMIWRQKSLQRKIGEFFIEENIIATNELMEMIRRHQQHNAKINLANNRF
ncbi:MAG: J domain-containing protein [Desulfobulbaceae bacterium]|nr:J domain-containing protein [Desulfobulbaceae bacterium]